MRVLLIEDDSAVAQSIELMLKSESFNVYTTDLGEEGVDLVDLLGQCLHCETLKFPRLEAGPLTSCLPASLIIASLSLVTESARPSEGRSSRRSRLGPPLNVEPERAWIQKTALAQYLRAIRKKLHGKSLRIRIRFC